MSILVFFKIPGNLGDSGFLGHPRIIPRCILESTLRETTRFPALRGTGATLDYLRRRKVYPHVNHSTSTTQSLYVQCTPC